MIEIKEKQNQMYLSFFMSSLEVWLLPAVKTIKYNPINNKLSQVMIVWLNYTLSNYDTIHTYTHSILSTALLIILRTVRYTCSHTFIFNLFSYQCLLVQNTTALESITINVILWIIKKYYTHLMTLWNSVQTSKEIRKY
jgi:hypothetical protein